MEKWLLAACAGPWILLSFYASWVGGNTFGPRYFAVAGLFLASFCASAEREIRGRPLLLAAWAGAVSACVAIHAVGAYFTWPGSQAIALEKAYLWSWSLHPIPNLASATGALGHLPLEARLLVVLAILAGSVWMASWMRGRLEAAR